MMNILPVSRPRDLYPVPYVKPQAPQAKLRLTEEDIRKLLPSLPKDVCGNFYSEDIINIGDTIPDVAPAGAYFPIADIFNQKYEFSIMYFQFNQKSGVNSGSGDDYEKYLQFPNQRLSNLANSIVDTSDSDDEKIYKIEQWVINNIDCVRDINKYGTEEFWAYPAITLNRGSGDCEDGAFLIHSLALHAGVPKDRLRTYGGFVEAEGGSFLLAGHAWTAYMREADHEWVEVDWCNYPTDVPLSARMAMQDTRI